MEEIIKRIQFLRIARESLYETEIEIAVMNNFINESDLVSIKIIITTCMEPLYVLINYC